MHIYCSEPLIGFDHLKILGFDSKFNLGFGSYKDSIIYALLSSLISIKLLITFNPVCTRKVDKREEKSSRPLKWLIKLFYVRNGWQL